jgi:hypothetical protein
MAMRALVLALVLIAVTPASGLAVTVDDLVALSKQGVADSVLIAVIDADRTVFTLTTQQVAALKRQGVSDAVIVKMLGTAHEFGADVEVAPHVVIIGGNQTPAAPPAPEVIGVPVYVPVPVAVGPRARHRDRTPPPVFSATPVLTPQVFTPPVLGPSPGFGRFMTNGWIDGVGFGRFITNSR